LHLFLKNKHIRSSFFEWEIEAFPEKNTQMASSWDPVERLYPFMLAAKNAGNRDAMSARATTFD
jgi:hypothetical protein